jgi:hypothetical protein
MEGEPIWDFDSDEEDFDIDDTGDEFFPDRKDLENEFVSKTDEQV